MQNNHHLNHSRDNHNKKPSFSKETTSLIFSFLISFFLTLFILFIVLSNTVFSVTYFQKTAVRSGFSELALEQIREIYISHGKASGVEEYFMYDAINLKQVEDAVEFSLGNRFNVNTEYNFDFYINELFEKLKVYAFEKGYEDNPELQTGLHDLAELCGNEFEAQVNANIFGHVISFILELNKTVGIIIFSFLIIIVVFSAALININRSFTRLARYAIYSLVASAIMCAVLPAIMNLSGILNRLNISPPSYKVFINELLKGIFNGLLWMIIPFVILITLLVIFRINKIKMYNQRRSRR